ncbi:helix-turn-helix domain-containing protein [Microbacterium sp. NPDC055903]
MPRTPSAAAALIGSRITAERQRRGLTQDQLAVLSDIDSSNIRSYEAGRSMLSVHTLVRISEALKVPPGKLIAGLTTDMFVPRLERKAG